MSQFNCYSERKLLKKTEKLKNPITATKLYWPMINSFLGKNVLNITALIVNDFFLNNFFASITFLTFSAVVNSSALPNFSYKTQKRIRFFLNNLKQYTSHNQKGESEKSTWVELCFICMLQLCRKPIVQLFKYLFQSYLTAGIFP